MVCFKETIFYCVGTLSGCCETSLFNAHEGNRIEKLIMVRVSIIIPIFKVRNFIERCVCSLFGQTLKEVEYIFVDDATPDDSIEILEACIVRYPERKEQVRILKHEQNQGLPTARNTGLAVATGEYVFHCDSDAFGTLRIYSSIS